MQCKQEVNREFLTLIKSGQTSNRTAQIWSLKYLENCEILTSQKKVVILSLNYLCLRLLVAKLFFRHVIALVKTYQALRFDIWCTTDLLENLEASNFVLCWTARIILKLFLFNWQTSIVDNFPHSGEKVVAMVTLSAGVLRILDYSNPRFVMIRSTLFMGRSCTIQFFASHNTL